jgi:hypothetical protein
MKPRHAAALALVGWFLMVSTAVAIGQVSDQADLENTRRAMQKVCDDNKWLLNVPHVARCSPTSTGQVIASGDKMAVGIFLDEASNVDEVRGKVPATLEGYPTVVLPSHVEFEFRIKEK